MKGNLRKNGKNVWHRASFLLVTPICTHVFQFEPMWTFLFTSQFTGGFSRTSLHYFQLDPYEPYKRLLCILINLTSKQKKHGRIHFKPFPIFSLFWRYPSVDNGTETLLLCLYINWFNKRNYLKSAIKDAFPLFPIWSLTFKRNWCWPTPNWHLQSPNNRKIKQSQSLSLQ